MDGYLKYSSGFGGNIKMYPKITVADKMNGEGYDTIILRNYELSDYFLKKGFSVFTKHFNDFLDLIVTYKNNEYDFYVTKFKNTYSLYYKTGDSNLENIYELLSEFKIKSGPQINLIIKTSNGFEMVNRPLTVYDTNIKTMYNDDFEEFALNMIDKLNNTKKGLFMLHGIPGAGKTNFIKWLTTQTDKKLVFVPNNMISQISNPEFLQFMLNNTNVVLVLEDCENYIKDRKHNNGENVVSSILNLSDGILGDVLNIQIICTFNADLITIDSALLRKGRMVGKYEFKALERSKAEELAQSIGVACPDDTTLSSIFNTTEKSYKVEKVKIGFN